MQAILIAPDPQMRQDIITGKKRITIRKGKRDVRSGAAAMLCCHVDPFAVMVDITRVAVTALKNVTATELEDSGFTNHDALLQDLKAYYSDITPYDIVTVIRWENPRGKLVDEVRDYTQNW